MTRPKYAFECWRPLNTVTDNRLKIGRTTIMHKFGRYDYGTRVMFVLNLPLSLNVGLHTIELKNIDAHDSASGTGWGRFQSRGYSSAGEGASRDLNSIGSRVLTHITLVTHGQHHDSIYRSLGFA